MVVSGFRFFSRPARLNRRDHARDAGDGSRVWVSRIIRRVMLMVTRGARADDGSGRHVLPFSIRGIDALVSRSSIKMIQGVAVGSWNSTLPVT